MNAHTPRYQRTDLQRLHAKRAVADAPLRLSVLPAEYRFAFLRDLTHPCKPLVFPEGLRQLAQYVHRERAGRAIQLDTHRYRVRGEESARPGILVWPLDPDGHPMRCLGWAWLDGGGFEELRDALLELEPDFALNGSEIRGG